MQVLRREGRETALYKNGECSSVNLYLNQLIFNIIPEGEKGFMSLHIMVSLEPLKAFFPLLIPSTCDINCQMQIYAKVAGVLVKNVENIETVPGKSDVMYDYLLRKEVCSDFEA